jgi:DNA-binding transcriptional regulator LsrR (DeoR family)
MRKPIIYKEYLERVLKLLYRTELRWGEEVIDNQSKTIAKELDIPVSRVDRIIDKHTKERMIKFNESLQDTKETELEELEVEYIEIKPVIKKRKLIENFSIDTNFYFNP